ncbi:hypothetical protein F5882DRAFT_378080 [Hyaloscypha sp. PMI_1271]|nr:hypothetical protein F5882DRAFT_378080 [Hyaloscypha sp. PMI_1271]
MEVDCNAIYGNPAYLVNRPHFGQHELDGATFAIVVALTDENDDELEPMEAGPDSVVFNHRVYQKSWMTDPAEIEDNILRTVEKSDSSSAYPLPPTIPTTSRTHYSLPPQAGVATLPQANYPATPQPQSVQPSAIALPQSQMRSIAMPPRARATNINPLQLLFDLSAHQRASVQVVRPSPFNPHIALLPGQIKRRSKWAEEHTRYLYELMELAMLLLNRPLEHGDFPAITEALHRQFRGTFSGNVPYPLRGYNTVHSYATRKEPYDNLLRRVLPDKAGNKTTFKPHNHQ